MQPQMVYYSFCGLQLIDLLADLMRWVSEWHTHDLCPLLGESPWFLTFLCLLPAETLSFQGYLFNK